MGLLAIGALFFWVASGFMGSKSNFFEERVTRFQISEDGSWEKADIWKSNGDVPDDYKAKVKKFEKKESPST